MNTFISARAGSGKTTEILRQITLLPPNTQNLVVAFNKAIATEMTDRLRAQGIVHAKATTLNALGYSYTRSLLPRIWVDAEKDEKILYFSICKKDAKLKRKFKNAPKLVALLKNLAQNPQQPITAGGLAQLEALYGLDSAKPGDKERYYKIVEELFLLSVTDKKTVDFNDQLWYPVFHNYRPGMYYDNVFVDEAQDLNACQIEFLKLLVGPRTALVAVGDPYQAIYGFRGSSATAIEDLKRTFQMEETTLTTCWRCSKQVIKEAQKLVPDIYARTAAPEGFVVREDKARMPQLLSMLVPTEPTFVLCRTRAPLVGVALERMQKGNTFSLRFGGGGADSVVELHEEFVGKADYLAELEEYRAKHVALLKAKNQYSSAAWLNDSLDILKEIASRTADPREIPNLVEAIFAGGNKTDNFVLSTIHQSKGLQAKHVYILRPDLLPHPLASSQWELDQERNLHYIAITRAEEGVTYYDDAEAAEQEERG